MPAHVMTDRPEDTTPFIGKPRWQLINDHTFQAACAEARFAGMHSPDIMHALRCTDGEQYVAWYIWLGRHPERYLDALTRNLAASAIGYVRQYAPACLPMLTDWRASRRKHAQLLRGATEIPARRQPVPEHLRVAIIDALERGMKASDIRNAVRCRRATVTNIARAWRASRVTPLTELTDQAPPTAETPPSMGVALVRQRVDSAGERYEAMLRRVLMLTEDYTASVRRDVASLWAMPMTPDAGDALMRALPRFNDYESRAASLVHALHKALDEYTGSPSAPAVTESAHDQAV
jgi:hypothetical protein